MERGAETGRDKGPKRNAQLQCLCFDNGAAARGEDKHENTDATTGTSLRQSARLLKITPKDMHKPLVGFSYRLDTATATAVNRGYIRS